MNRKTLAVALGLSSIVAGCSQNEAPIEDPAVGAEIAISVAPLTLEGIEEASYTLTVVNSDLETVWTKTINSTQYGDGQGAVTYVGPCDAGKNDNRVRLILNSLRAGGRELVNGTDYVNPAPSANPLEIVTTCVENADTAVTFNLTIARAAQQGFFDFSVNFEDIFCSAKFDCKDGGNNLELLFNPHTGERDQTAVLGFACTSGPDSTTFLHMSKIEVECEGRTFIVDAETGPGNLNPPFPGPPNTSELFFQTAVYRGDEVLGNLNKAYWNVALGLNADAFDTYPNCTVKGFATASEAALPGGATTAGMRWPLVTWNVPLTDASGAFVCDAYKMGEPEVAVVYSTETGAQFAGSYERGVELVQTFGCEVLSPCGTCSSSCSTAPSGGGRNVDGNGETPPLSDEIDNQRTTGDISGLVASSGGGLTLADQSYDLPFIWIANSADNTVSKLNTETGLEVGRYRVCANPSRTSVDLNSDVFVGCRNDGGVVKIGSVDSQCDDRNGNLTIETSRDLNGDGTISGTELLPAGDDECVLWTVFPNGVGGCSASVGCARAAGVDRSNHVWMGFWSSKKLIRLDGETGATLATHTLSNNPYGLAIDPQGIIWVSSRAGMTLAKVDPVAGQLSYWAVPGNDAYGLAVGPYGRIWVATYAQKTLRVFDPTTETWVKSVSTAGYSRGVAVRNLYDSQGNLTDSKIFAGQSNGATWLAMVQNDANIANIPSSATSVSLGAGTDPVGVAVDAAGKVWGINYSSNNATRINVDLALVNPNNAVEHTQPVGSNPYTYSDMTGQALRNISATEGVYTHVFEGWQSGQTVWSTIDLEADLPPGDGTTSMTVRYRVAATEAALDSEAWIAPQDNLIPPGTMPMVINAVGAFFELEVVLNTTDVGFVPTLNEVGVVVYHL